VPLLIIDDFGLKPLRAPADEDLHDLIAERYEQASTIVTSNLDFPEWDQAFPATACWPVPAWTGCATTPTAWCWTGSPTDRDRCLGHQPKIVDCVSTGHHRLAAIPSL
jgi:hypothetical protein